MIRAFDPDPSLTWLFLFPHPDDEVAVGAWIRRLTAQGNEVWLSWIHDTAVRRAEAARAAEFLGVPPERCVFQGAPDGQVVDSLDRLLPRLAQLMEQVQPDRICTVAFEQGHLDHDATNLLANLTFGGPVLEYPMYHTYTVSLQTLNEFAVPAGEEVLDLTCEERALKSRLLRLYPSQTIRRNVLWYGIWRRLTLRPVYLDRVERMRVQTHRDFLSPHLSPALAEKVRRHESWLRWVSVVSPFLEQAGAKDNLKWHRPVESE